MPGRPPGKGAEPRVVPGSTPALRSQYNDNTPCSGFFRAGAGGEMRRPGRATGRNLGVRVLFTRTTPVRSARPGQARPVAPRSGRRGTGRAEARL